MKYLYIVLLLLPLGSTAQITLDTATAKRTSISIRKLIKADSIEQADLLMKSYLQLYQSPQTHDDSVYWGFSMARMGDRYRRAGYFTKALPFYKKALPIYEGVFGKQALNTGKIEYNLGICYAEKGITRRAALHFEKTSDIFIQELGENHHFVANVYNALGNTYTDLLQFEKALNYFGKANSILQKQDKLTSSAGRVLNNMGNIHRRMKAYQLAVVHFQQAVNCYNQFDDEETVHSKMNSFFNIGETYMYTEQYDSSEYYFQKIKTFQENNQGYQVDLAVTYAAFARLHLAQKKYKTAHQYILQSIHLTQLYYGKKHPNLVENYITLSNIFHAQNNLDSALFYIQKGLNSTVTPFQDEDIFANPTPSAQINSQSILNALNNKAELFLRKFEEKEEEKWLKASIDVCLIATKFSSLLRNSLSHSEQLQLSETIKTTLNVGIESAYLQYLHFEDAKAKEQVLLFSEKKKATSLANILTNLTAQNLSGIPSHLLQREEELKEEVTYYRTEIQKLKENSPQSPELEMPLVDSLFLYSNAYDDLIAQFEERFPRYFQLKHNSKVISSRQLQSLLNPNSIIVSYSIHNQKIIISTLSDTSFNITQKIVENESFNLDKSIYHIHQLLQKKNLVQTRYRDEFAQTAHQLYQYLIAPIRSQIDGYQRLIIIPEGMLHYLPFEVLLSSDTSLDFQEMPYLIKDFELSYHYSSTIFNHLTKIKNHKTTQDLLAVAPVFDYEESNSFVQRQYGALPWSEREIDYLAQKFDSKRTRLLKREQAIESNFKSHIEENSFDIVHLSSHGLANPAMPDLSWIAFYKNDDAQEEDGLLYAGEIYNLDLNTNLLVLSSCESGLGQLAEGEGMISMNRGFLYAGALNVVYSLWKVNDRYTYELMKNFYDNIAEKKPYPSAIRAAKLGLIQSSKLGAVPTNWAGFLLIGQ